MTRCLLPAVLLLALFPAAQVQPAPLHIRVDAEHPVGRLDPGLWGNIGYDPMYAATVAEEAQPVWEAIRASGAFRYVRTHNLFSDGLARGRPIYFGTRIYSEDAQGRPRYQWWFLDEVLDIWLAAGLKPIMEVDFMPDALADGEIVRNYGGGAINGPRDFQRWRDLIYETVLHVEGRYGRDEVRTWYWEIWNEPDLYTYFIGGMRRGERFRPEGAALLAKMYDYFVDGATAADPMIKVGGPGLAGNVEVLRAFLRHVTSGTNHVTGGRGTRIDFISWHGYSSNEAMTGRNRLIRAMIRDEFSSLAGIEVQQNEWGQALVVRGLPNMSSSFYTNYEAAFLVRFVQSVLDDPSARVDRFLRWGQPLGTGRTPWRTLTRQIGPEVVRTPVFLAYELLGRLGQERIAVSGSADGGKVGAIAARSPGGVQVILHHLDEGNEAGVGLAVPVDIEVRGLHGTEISAAIYRIDHGRGNFWPHWLASGQSDRPTGAQMRAITEAAALRPLPEPTRLAVESGVARITITMPVNSVALLALGDEPRRAWNPGPHIRRVLAAEEAFKAARRAAAGPDRGAQGYLAVADQYPDLFWSQRALRAAIDLLDRKGDAAGADGLRQRLLRTPLGDPERLQRLQERAAFLQRAGGGTEAEPLLAEAAEIRARIARVWRWSD